MVLLDELLPLLCETGTEVWGCCPFEKVSGHLIPCRAQQRIMEGAKSVLIGLFPYLVRQEEGNLCRYARVPDYHHVVGDLLKQAAHALVRRYPGHRFEPFVDNSPIPEVRTAALAGLGCIGDNGLLLHSRYGSWCVIGEVVTDLEVASTGGETWKRCMGCGACRKACPGEALGETEFVRSRCLSDVTQRKGDLTGEEQQKIAQNGLCWGCDTCQLVCPANREVVLHPLPAFARHYGPSYPPEQKEGPPRAWEWRGDKVIRRNLCIIQEKRSHTNPAK